MHEYLLLYLFITPCVACVSVQACNTADDSAQLGTTALIKMYLLLLGVF